MIKKAVLIITMCLLLLTISFYGCKTKDNSTENEHIDLNDPLSGEGIVSASELMEFFEHGDSNTATLAASISLDSQMLTLSKQRGDIIINGEGFTLSGNGDCVIRMEEGCSITLNNIHLIAGASAIGALGSVSISGKNAVIDGITHTFYINGNLTIESGTEFTLSSSVGSAIKADGLVIGENSHIIADGELSAVNLGANGLVLKDGAYLQTTTEDDYNALKSEGIVELCEGSELNIANHSYYHGAEIDSLKINGVVTINASGGGQGVGLFLVELTNDLDIVGSCVPAPRFESGRGSITFHQTKDEARAAIDEKKALADAESAANGEGENADDDVQP